MPYCYFHINDIQFRFLYIDGACIKRKHIWPKEVGLEKTGHFVFTYKFIKFSSSCLTLVLVNSGVIVVCYCVLYLPKLTSLSIKFWGVVLQPFHLRVGAIHLNTISGFSSCPILSTIHRILSITLSDEIFFFISNPLNKKMKIKFIICLI